MKARYARVSNRNQKLEYKKKHPDKILFIDVISGSIPFKERPMGKKLMSKINSGGIKYISVPSIDVLGKNLFDILSTLELLNDKLITLKVDNLDIESLIDNKPNHTFALITSVMTNIAEMERESFLLSQREGIARAKAKGTYKGRVKGSKESDDEVLDRYKNVIKHLENGDSLRVTAKNCEVSLGTVQKVKAILKKSDR